MTVVWKGAASPCPVLWGHEFEGGSLGKQGG